ncbi:MAG: heavy metal-binding domain-containing protein [Aquificota bacterium]|nr:heavy metal-binding domain-containing protein [Aquificota bacterium]MDQ7082830.1 heavy metal-binding domain-containing protein [Aquificota bacterium]
MLLELSLGILIGGAVVYYLMRRGRSKVGDEKRQVREDTSDVIVTYSKTIPGYEVKRIYGVIESYSVFPLEEDVSQDLAEEDVVHKLMVKAKSMGANAILDLKIERETFKEHIRIKATGLAVRV